MRQEIKLSKDNDSALLEGISQADYLFSESPYLSFVGPPKHLINLYGKKRIIRAEPKKIPLTDNWEIDFKGLRKIIEENKRHVKLIFRNPRDESYILHFELPQASGNDLYVREVFFDWSNS